MTYTIPQAAKLLKLSEAYVRMMIRRGIIKSEKRPIREGSFVMQHWVSQQEIDMFANRESRRAPRRGDGRAKWCFYATEDEALRVQELLYLSHEDSMAIVAQTIPIKHKAEEYIPPSKR